MTQTRLFSDDTCDEAAMFPGDKRQEEGEKARRRYAKQQTSSSSVFGTSADSWGETGPRHIGTHTCHIHVTYMSH